jgi:hypothetical protein
MADGKITKEEAFNVINGLIKQMRQEGNNTEYGLVCSTENYVITLITYPETSGTPFGSGKSCMKFLCDLGLNVITSDEDKEKYYIYRMLHTILVRGAIEKYQPNIEFATIKYDDDVALVARTNKEEKLNSLLAQRITDKIENLWSMTEIDLEKFFKRVIKYGGDEVEGGKYKMCARCCKKGVKKCPCRKERYCSSECQKKDWELHKHIHTK